MSQGARRRDAGRHRRHDGPGYPARRGGERGGGSADVVVVHAPRVSVQGRVEAAGGGEGGD